MSRVEPFKDCSQKELKYIYKGILKGREEGLRPRCMDKYIEKVRTAYNTLDVAGAWKYTEGLFWDEVGRRYFG